MKLSQLKIKGFRSLADVEIPLQDMTILVGRNNAGKSNLLSAIRLLLEGTTRDLSQSDFSRQGEKIAEEIILEAYFEGVDIYLPLCDDRHRTKIQNSLQEGVLRVRRIATLSPLKLGKLEIWQPSKRTYGLPTGIENALKQFLPECIFIEAFKDPSTEAQAKSTAALGKLLKQIVERVTKQVGREVRSALQGAESKLNILEETGQIVDRRPEELKRIEQRIRHNIQEIFEGADVRLTFKFPDVNEFIATTATLQLKDRGPWTPPGLKGQGFQRVLYLALLRALAEEIRASSEVGREKSELSRPFILLFEEPEAFLHPALQREMGEALQSISVGNQVVVSTHSPILVTPERVESVIILRQEPSLEGSCITRCSIPHLDLLPNEEDKQLAAMLKFTNSSEFLFADHVLVVEGPSDRALLEACWSKSRKSLRDTSGPTTLAIIEACSKNVVPIWLEYLKAMGLIACGVLDLDFLWDGAGRCLGPDDDLSRFSESFWKLAEEDGIACKRDNGYFIPSEKKREAFALVCQRLGELTEKLRSRLRDLGIWVLSKGEIECYFNLSPSSKSQYAKASQKVRKGEIEIDPEIHDILRWVLQYPPRAGGVGADGIRTSTIGGPQ